MPLSTNRCEKHGNAYPEDDCPYCKHEHFTKQMAASKEFFRKFGGVIVLAPTIPKGEKITVEDVFQHFRIRLLEELNPVLQRIAKDAQDLGIAAFNANR